MLMASNLWRGSLLSKESYHSLCQSEWVRTRRGEDQTSIQRMFLHSIDGEDVLSKIVFPSRKSCLWADSPMEKNENVLFEWKLPSLGWKEVSLVVVEWQRWRFTRRKGETNAGLVHSHCLWLSVSLCQFVIMVISMKDPQKLFRASEG